MNNVDAAQLNIIIKDTIYRLQFLGQITVQDDISSELAGYQISKLLKQQTKLQDQYAQLVEKRISLKGILNQDQLMATQQEITSVASNLKQSTQKLCRLFKENPDIKKDAANVSEERRDLEQMLMELQTYIEQNQLSQFQVATTKELENQDYLRQLMEKDQKLCADIKNIQLEHTKEFKEFQEEKEDRKNQIQHYKTNLMYQTNRATLQQAYYEAQATAQVNTEKRKAEYKIEMIRKEKADYEEKIQVEKLVFAQLKQYLIQKEKAIAKEASDWNDQMEQQKEELTQEINKLRERQDQALEELEGNRAANERIEIERFETERKEQEENERKLKQEQYQIKLENAIRFIQKEFVDWKAAGGGKKRGKRGGKQKK